MQQKKSGYRVLIKQLSLSVPMVVFCSAFASSAQSGDASAYTTDGGYSRHDSRYSTTSDVMESSGSAPDIDHDADSSLTHATYSRRLSSSHNVSTVLGADNSVHKVDVLPPSLYQPAGHVADVRVAQKTPAPHETRQFAQVFQPPVVRAKHEPHATHIAAAEPHQYIKVHARPSERVALAANHRTHKAKASEVAKNTRIHQGAHPATVIAQQKNPETTALLASNTPAAAATVEQTQTAQQTLPWLAQGGTKANVNLVEAVDRKEQQVAATSSAQTTSLDLPWLTGKTSQPFVNVASAQHPMTESVKIEPLGNSNTTIMPAAYVQASSTMPPVPPAALNMAPQAEAAAPLSVQSKSIVDSLPPEKPKTFRQLEPVNIEHARKNTLDDQVEEKTHNGIGIKISVKQPRESITKMLEAAYDDLIAGDQGGAVELYRKVLSIQPQNKLALFGLATTYHRAGLIEQARPLYCELLSIDPNNVEGLNNFLVLLSDENPRDALAELDKLEKTHPSFSPIPAQMAIIYEKTGDYDKAAEKMNTALTLSPENLKYRYDMAIILDKSGDWADAAVLYRELLTAHDRGEKISADAEEIQQRLTFILSNKPRG